MTRINQRLLRALEQKLSLKTRMVYDLISREASENLVDRHLAAIILARNSGINISKYATSDELASLRGVPQKQITHVPTTKPNISPRASKLSDPVIINMSFISNKHLRNILTRDIRELNLASSQGLDKLTKTCIILAGSIAEALLLNSLSRRKKKSLAIASSLSQRPSNNIEEWDLFEMVSVASKMSPPLLPEDVTAGATQLRKWRNLIHPGRELRDMRSKKILLSKGRARHAIAFLQLIGEQLSK